MTAERPVVRADRQAVAVSRPELAARLIAFKPAPRSGSALFGYATVAFGALVIVITKGRCGAQLQTLASPAVPHERGG